MSKFGGGFGNGFGGGDNFGESDKIGGGNFDGIN